MIKLGKLDTGVSANDIRRFWSQLEQDSRRKSRKVLQGDKGDIRLTPVESGMSVADLQHFLVDTNFLNGGDIDIRRSKETDQTARWSKKMSSWSNPGWPKRSEYQRWLTFLDNHRQHWLYAPDKKQALFRRNSKATDTRKLADWNLDTDTIHLIGIRFDQRNSENKFDDLVVPLLKGLEFQFQGSTDPGHSSNPNRAPFLLPCQHAFRFGVRRGSYPALRPLGFVKHGVLVVRAKRGFDLSPTDIARGPERNGSINNTGVRKNSRKTCGAYNVLSDLIARLSTDLLDRGQDQYTLLESADLKISPGIQDQEPATRKKAKKALGVQNG